MRLIALTLLLVCGQISAAIPSIAFQYERQIKRAAWTHFGTDRYVGMTFAQAHTESYFNGDAVSWVGAAGLFQFMPATAKDESRRCGLGIASPFDDAWSILANACYMSYLHKRNYEFIPGCERMAATTSAYNGGQGNVNKQRRKWAYNEIRNANRNVNWFGGVELYRVRGKAAHKENTHYPRRILLDLMPQYVQRFGGKDLCKNLT